MTATVTVGFVPKDRFHTAPEALQRLFDATTDIDFHLIVVDTCTPVHYWNEMESVLAGRENVEVIRPGSFQTLGASKNLAAEASRTDYTCLIENDVFVSDGWLSKLVGTAEEFGADAVAPFVMEQTPTRHHEDQNLGFMDLVEGPKGLELRVRRLASSKALDHMTVPQRIDVAETHCLLVRTDLLRRVQVFDPVLNMQDFSDVGLNLREAGASYYFEPRVRVTIMPPPPVKPDEYEFFFTTWDKGRAQRSLEHMREKWGIAVLPPGSKEWIDERHHSLTRRMHMQHALKYLVSARWKRAPGSAKRRLAALLSSDG